MQISTERTPRSVYFPSGSTFQPRPFTPTVQLQSTQDALENSSLSSISQAPSGLQSRSLIQCKLSIGQMGDRYEQEADRVAQQVVQRINAPSSSGQSQTAEPQTVEPTGADQFHAHVQRSILHRAAPSQKAEQSDPLSISSTGTTGTTVQRLPGQQLFSNPMMKRYLKQKAMQGFNYMNQQASAGMQYAKGVAQQYPTQAQMVLDYGQEKAEEWAGRDGVNGYNAFQHLRGNMSDEDFYHNKFVEFGE
jgi:hypothetical protein